PASTRESASYVDWSAIIAGILFASAISLLFIAFGSAIRLNLVGFNARDAAPGLLIGVAAASRLLWVQVSSLMAGGYLAGRLRRRHFDATEDESDVRDGAHGLIVWAGATVLGAMIALGGVGAAVSVAGSALSTATTATATVAQGT